MLLRGVAWRESEVRVGFTVPRYISRYRSLAGGWFGGVVVVGCGSGAAGIVVVVFFVFL